MSNRLTFSLASLIVLIGLLAAPAFVHAQSVTNVAFTSTPPYKIDDKVQVTVTFSGPVDVTTSTGGVVAALVLDSDDATVGTLSYVSDSSTSTALVFESSAIAAGTTANTDNDTDGLGIQANIRVNDTTIAPADTTSTVTTTFTAVPIDSTQVVDRVAPTYTAGNITSDSTNATFHKVGAKIQVTLTFGEPMQNAGRIPFQIGTDFQLLEVSSTTGNTVTFSYTVKSGDSGAVQINQQGVPQNIKDIVGNKVLATTQLLGTISPFPLGTVNSTQPTVTDIAITSTGPYTDITTATGDTIDVKVTFSTRMKVTGTGTPQIELTIGEGTAQAPYVSGAGSAELVFSHSIVAADAGDVSIAADALAGGSIVSDDAFENPANLTHAAVATSENQTVDSAAPTVTAAAITSKAADADDDRTYVTDEKITAKLTFSEIVNVTGAPTLKLTLGSNEGTATYVSGSGSADLVFSYTVMATDSADGVSVKAGSLTLGTDITIQDAVKHNIVDLTHPASAKQKADVNPDTEAPAMRITVPSMANSDGDVVFTIDFDEALGEGFSQLQDGDFTIDGGTGVVAKSSTATDGKIGDKAIAETYTLTVTPDGTGDGSVTISLNANSVADADGNAITLGDSTMATYDKTPPTVVIAKGAQSGSTLPVTITVADETALGTATGDATIEKAEVTVTGGTLGALTEASSVFSGDITIDDDTTSVTVTVAAGAVKDAAGNTSKQVSEDFSVTSTSAPTAEGEFKIPAESYIIVGRDKTPKGLPAGVLPTGVEVMEWPKMPDLQALFYSGGTVLLTTAKATLLDRDNKSDTAAEAAKKRDALITEVMAAVNSAKVGEADYIARQWIELYNNLPVEITVKLSATAGRPVPDASATEIRLDRLSNQVGAGWKFEGLGQNGSDDGVADTANIDFVSFFRKERAGDKDGHVKAHWATSTVYYLAGHKGTPGKAEPKEAGTIETKGFTLGNVIINEVANTKNPDHEWIEFRNKGTKEENLKNWQVSLVRGVGDDKKLFDFPDADVKIPAGDVLLVVAKHPTMAGHPLAAGWDIRKGANDQVDGVGEHSPRYQQVDFAEEMPDDGEFVLVLRNHKDKLGKNEHIQDIAGYDDDLKVPADQAGYTNMWPLKGGVGDAQIALNKIEADKVHRRQKDDIWGTRTSDKADNADHVALRDVGWTGIGYDRNAAVTAMNGGTPGYPNNAYISAGDDATKEVIISEIMYNRGTRNNLPQWIELQNMSATKGVDLHNWRLYIVNHDNPEFSAAKGKVTDEIWLRDMNIPPLQTALIVSRAGRNTTNLPSHRVLNLRRNAPLLSSTGFELRLEAKSNEGDAAKRQAGDMVSNLDAPDANQRRANNQAFTAPVWALPSGMDENGDRVSIARRTSSKIKVLDGTSEWHWILSNEDTRTSLMNSTTYYGHANDISSPGQTLGGVLPVSLSKFRPERLESGEIVIRWITQSELNNAGFNILRSEKRDGEFKQINTKLIAGQGTTSEKTTYEWKDTSAKPTVVYYYQIQDVSLDGQVQTLRTSRLKGHISPAGKATTTWGELKALQ